MQDRFKQVGEPRVVKKFGGIYSVGKKIEVDGLSSEVVEEKMIYTNVRGRSGYYQGITIKYPDGRLQAWLSINLKSYIEGKLNDRGDPI